jgi:S-DNA-T family DNA segregation ATPase FtsK/SpoIIIE
VIPVGVGAQGPFAIDLVADGPHMLVAGTTGAGKSELLQSLIVATATTYSAHDVNFMLIDYKGGAGLGRCHRLPHSCGMVTDLDPGETSRALAGLRAELKRRELRFREVGVGDITEFNRTVSRVDRIARIVVVVDEFRALSEEHPEFLTKLIRLAAQGRSLGIHLILATQRPAGAVGPELRANINLRISLRVADEQDSLDVLGVKDGAYLPVEVPGRFLARTGGARPTQAQAFYLDAAPPLPQHLVTLPGARGPDTPTADVPDVIGALVSAHDARFGIRATRFWSPGLPSVFTGQQNTEVLHDAQVVALGAPEDSTGHQALTWEPTLGHLAVVGPSLRGRTSTLLSLAQCSPAGTRIHWVGPVTDHIQVKRALTSASAYLVNLVDSSNPYMVHALIRAIASTSATPGPAQSRTVLVIDDLNALRTTLETYDRGSGMELVEYLLKIGPAQGIACAVSAARPITGGLQSLFGQRLILASGNVDTDATNAVPRELLPLPSHRGRAVWSTPNGTVACQIRTPHLATQATQWDSENHDEQRIWSLADVPASPTPGILTGPRPSAFDPTTVNAMIVAGARRSGRSTALDALAANWAGTPYGSRRIAGRGHHLGSDLEELIGVLETGTQKIALIQIDDLDVVEATHGHLVQRLLDLALGAGITVHGSCTTAALHQSYRGALATLREYENVLLLCPDPAKDRELLGTSIVLAVDPRPHPGKAVLMLAGHIAAARVDCGKGES